MQMNRQGYKPACAFTLIELLVVIAIISLLVSILLPSLTKAKDLAKTVICQNNVRGLSMAFSLYAEEYDGYWPGRAGCTGTVAYDRWVPSGNPVGWTGHPDFDVAKGALYPYTDSRQLYLCPSYSHPNYSKLNYAQSQELYGSRETWRQRSQPDGHGFFQPYKAPDPETLVNLIDQGNSNDGLFSIDDYGYPDGSKLDWRHGGTLHFLMVDGHFEIYAQYDEMVLWKWGEPIWY
jgi:prepilin-type N-terminal cleavage/methylation domain-containing protein/prepilin-type processing-associated H-X9-DG protein